MNIIIFEKVENLIMPLFEELKLDLVDLHVGQSRGNVNIKILTDKPAGGITIEECSALNKRIIALIESVKLISGNYSVEVSSPGIDWPLRTKKDFLRVMNRKVRIYWKSTDATKLFEGEGFLKEVGDEVVVIKSHLQEVQVPIKDITKATQVI